MDHNPSATPSPVPPPPRSTENEQHDRSTALPGAPRVPRQATSSSSTWFPDDDDVSPRATDWRARRGMRIALETRASIGRPTTKNSDGTTTAATGIWAILEPLKEMADDWNEQKKKRSGVLGFFATRGEKILDRVLLMAVIALVGYLSRHYWAAPPPAPSPAPPAAAQAPPPPAGEAPHH